MTGRKKLWVTFFSLLGGGVLSGVAMGAFMYKARYGINFYETTPPVLPAPLGDKTVLIFSKTNGYRHGATIKAALSAFRQMAIANGWSLFITENGAVFNEQQLAHFKVVVRNNTSGKVLTTEQRRAFQNYLEQGGGFVGIHAAGDYSHQWAWYEQQVIGAQFSHHPFHPQIQAATMHLAPDRHMPELTTGLPLTWTRPEEWYMFFNPPRQRGFRVLYTVDEQKINPNGNLWLVTRDKNWGMGADHPIVWYKQVRRGRVFYSALGHQPEAFAETAHLKLLENAIRWAGKLPAK